MTDRVVVRTTPTRVVVRLGSGGSGAGPGGSGAPAAKLAPDASSLDDGTLTATESGLWVARTAAQVRTLLGLGGAATKNVGTAAGTVAAGNDSRFTDARTPTAHADSHGNAGADRTTLDASQITSGVLPVARLATGTPDGSKFVRDDGTLATPSLTPWEVTPALYPRVIGGTPWTTAQSASAYGGYYLRNNASLNEYIRWDVLLGAGTWTFEMYYVTETTGGIATVALDGTTIGTFDTYGATLTWNVKATTTGITVATTGVKELRITMATKNASSSAYKIDLTGLLLRRTA